MTIKHPTIVDIQTSTLIYYDQNKVAENYEFCQQRDIDCLPDVSNPSVFYRRNDEAKQLVKEKITQERRIEAATCIFSEDLLDRFKQNPVQFVFDHGNLTGVVHFSDYNKEIVSIYLYAQLRYYERDLRNLLESKGLRNEDMCRRFKEILAGKKEPKDQDYYQKKIHRCENNKTNFSKWPQFQSFDLQDLMDLAKENQLFQPHFEIVALRNAIMHMHDPINMRDYSTPDFIYEIDSFVTFFRNAGLTIQDRCELGKQLQNLQGSAPEESSTSIIPSTSQE